MPTQVFEPDEQLTAIAIGYKNDKENYIADKILPYIPVESAQFSYNEYPLEEGFSVPDTKVGRVSAPKTVDFSAMKHTAEVEDHALDVLVPNWDKTRAPKNYDPEGRGVENATNLCMLARELRVAKLVKDPNNYAYKQTLSGTSQFDNASCDPLGIFVPAIEKMLVSPNALIMSMNVWTKLRLNPNLLKAVHGTAGDKGAVSRQQLAELLEIPEIIIGNSRYNVAKQGQTASIEPCWQDYCGLLYINPNADNNQGMTFGMTARLGDKVAGRIFDPNMGMRGGYKVRSGESIKEVIVAKQCGFLFETPVSAA